MDTAAEPETKETQNTVENPPALSEDTQTSSREPPRPSDEPGASQTHNSIKPNKVYIGGLPDDTREADLRGCFGTFGTITSIELKTGYGFVEFNSRVAAEKAVAVYHEGSFLGNTIRVELSHGGGKASSKALAEPGACFKCGQHGHWARECPNHTVVLHRKGWVDRSGSHGGLHSRSDSLREGQTGPLAASRLSRDDYRSGGRRQEDYGAGRDYGMRDREPRRPSSPYYDYNRPVQPVAHGYDDRRYPPGPARPVYVPDRPTSPYGRPRATSAQVAPRDYGRGFERPSASYEPRPLPHNAPSYADNGSFARRSDGYPPPPHSIPGGVPYSDYPPARDHAGRRSPLPRVGGRYQEYNGHSGYERPYERRRSASPPAYRSEGTHSQGGHASGNGYSRANTASYGRPDQYSTGSSYVDHRSGGSRATHVPPITNANPPNRVGEREYRPYRG